MDHFMLWIWIIQTFVSLYLGIVWSKTGVLNLCLKLFHYIIVLCNTSVIYWLLANNVGLIKT